MTKTTIKLLTITLIMTTGLIVQGQAPKTYNGNFNSINFQGTASYSYYEDNSEQRIFNGPFSFKAPKAGASVSGSYSDNLKNGNWKIVLTNVPNTELIMKYSITATVSGSYDKGNLNGMWTLSRTKIISFSESGISNYYKAQISAFSYLFDEKKIDFSKSSSATETSTVNFSNNKFAGNFIYSVNKGKSIVKGQFNENGYFNGAWSITYYQDGVLISQTKTYLNGLLLTVKSKDNSTGEITTIYDKSKEVNEFLQNYNEKGNYSKVGDSYLKLAETNTLSDNDKFVGDAISMWFNSKSLSKSSYLFEIERGANLLTVFPERIIVTNDEKNQEQEQLAEDAKRIEEAKKNQERELKEAEDKKIREFKRSDYGKLQESVKEDFSAWLKKTEFETNSDYENRIKNQADETFKVILAEKIEKAKQKGGTIKYAKMGNYDAESESFPLTYNSQFANIKISKTVAPDFYSKFANRTGSNDQPTIYVIPSEFIMINNSWQVSKALFIFDGYWMGADFVRDQAFKKFYKENEKYYYDREEPNFKTQQNGINKYTMISANNIKSASDIQREVYYYEFTMPSTNESQALNFTYKDLNITLPQF